MPVDLSTPSPRSRAKNYRKSESDRLHKPFTPGITSMAKKSSERTTGAVDLQHKHLKRYSHSAGKKKSTQRSWAPSKNGAAPPPPRRVEQQPAEVYTAEAANPQADDIPEEWRRLPRTFKSGDRVQANLEDNQKVAGVVKRVYVKSAGGQPVGKYKINWEGDVNDMDVSDAESDNLEPYEGDNQRTFSQMLFGLCL